MIAHHQSAVAMAELAKERVATVGLARGRNPGLRRLARNIVATQSREIKRIREWRDAWYGSATGESPPAHDGHGDEMMDHQP